MKKFLFVLMSFVLFLSVSGAGLGTVDAAEERRMIVVFDESLSEHELVEKVEDTGGEVTEMYEQVNVASISMPVLSIGHLMEDPAVKAVEEDIQLELSAQLMDWGIESSNIPAAWNSGYSGKGVKVAVIDSGISQHRDLEIAGGISTVDYTSSYGDDEGHGTHVAGIIGARNNSFGVKGTAYESEIYAVKAFDQNGEAYLSDIIQGINWSIANDMDIINLSSGSQTDSTAYRTVIDKAYASGLLIVAAAGNDGALDGLEDTVDYPARYLSVIGVGAVDSNLSRATFSSTGPDVEVAAPGARILSTYLEDKYAYMSGTSMATPYVTGLLALLKQANPNLTNKELRLLLIEKTKDLGDPGRDPFFGYGLIQSPAFEEPIELEDPNPVTRITLSENAISGSPGQAINVTAAATHQNGSVLNITGGAEWSSADPAVAEATNGKVTLKGYGSTTVTVSYKGLEAVILVNVPTPPPVPTPTPAPSPSPAPTPVPQPIQNPVVKLEVNNTSILGKPGEFLNVTATATYGNGTVQDVTNLAEWSSGNAAVATVTDGKVELNGYGSTTITVTYGEQSTMFVVNCPEPLKKPVVLKFNDVSPFYSLAVEYLVRNQITRGMSETEFGVSRNIIRADAAIWLAKELNLNTQTAKASGFKDVPDRAVGAVNALKAAGIIGGKSGASFGAYDPLTRGEIALILQRAYKLSSNGQSSAFTDVSPVYKDAVNALVENHVTNGISPTKYGISNRITRGQLAVFLYRLSTR